MESDSGGRGEGGHTVAKASKKGEGGSTRRPHPMVCWLQEEGSFLGLCDCPNPTPRSPGPWPPCRDGSLSKWLNLL